MVTDKRFTTDPNYQNIGDLPTGYFAYRDIDLREIYLRPFRLTELPLIHLTANSPRGIFHLTRAVNACSSVDVNVLTDGDFTFLLAWLRRSSYPESPTFVRWTCANTVMRKIGGDDGVVTGVSHEDMAYQGLEYGTCGWETNELINNAAMRITSLEDDFDSLPSFMDFPRVGTLQELNDIRKECPEDAQMAEYARWVKAGNTLEEKLVALDVLSTEQFVELMRVSKEHYHGVYEMLPLRCRNCGYKTTYRQNVNFTTFFADNSDKNILDIQYSLLAEFGLQPNENMLVKQLLYHNSCLVKDRKEDEEKRRLDKAVRGNKYGRR